MKNILLTLLVCFSLMKSNAQAPQGIPYQSVIRNGSGVLLINQSVQVRFSIHDSIMNGNIVYQETHATTTSAAAMIILTIGQGIPVIGNFSAINWGNGAKFMQVELDVTGGNNFIDLGTQQMMSVPYALYAATAGNTLTGPTGPTGPQGPIGLTGLTGTQGIQGLAGPTGPQGPIGLTGLTGAQGIQGLEGSTGPQGLIGLTGATGPQGPIGLTGATGPQGNAGTSGATGPQGSAGTNGATGTQGPIGLTGATGPQGSAGTNGATGTFPNGTTAGEMMYWNGTAWVSVAPGPGGLQGTQAVTLKFCNGVPIWGDCPAGLATLTTTAISAITYTTSSSGGTITNDGGAAVTARGVCWSTSSNPTVALSTKTIDGSGTGSFTSSIAGLAASTTYYVRAYATNSVGTSYGNQVVFTTTAFTLATLTTTAISAITNTTASSGGSISLDGGAAVTARGVCWSTSSNPTAALSTKTIDGSGTGSFISSITSLIAGTTYYVRAYATNSVGTAYGNQVVFTTSGTPPIIIGSSYQGGIVAYILQAGDLGYSASVPHGLIAAPSDQSTSAEWGCYGTQLSGADGTGIGTGNQNTIDIMNGCGTAGIAARICGNLVLNGYSDWYLPSKDELNKLYLNRAAIGGFAAYEYWSSSEHPYLGNGAWVQVFVNGSQANPLGKGMPNYVRAVRAF